LHMEWFGVRDRNQLFKEPDLLMHEMLHVHGYGHGPAHDAAIRATQMAFNAHHIYLADHPEYEPQPVVISERWDK